MSNEEMNVVEHDKPEVGKQVPAAKGEKKQKVEKVQKRVGLPTDGRIHILRPGLKDLEFTGQLVAEVNEGHGGDPTQYKKDRWTRLSLYSVDGKPNQFVGVVSHIPYIEGKTHIVYECEIFSNHEGLEKLFHHTPLAKRLYEKIGVLKSAVFTESLN